MDAEPPDEGMDRGFPASAGEALFGLGFLTCAEEPTQTEAIGGQEQAGDRVGPYELLELLGEGGFGRVWLARQTTPIRRDLALKLIKPGMDSREIIARFEAESRALALMDHPNIAAVVDAGTSPDGRFYFAMEVVRGIPVTQYCREKSLTLRERVELFIPVCHAVQHAHQKAILHRDLKPSNILIVEVDGRPTPKVIDFGIAKALGAAEATEASLLVTRAGMLIGTPQYMSPEQAGSVEDVDTRSDIYSLGVIFYELLTGRTPLGSAAGAGLDEVLRRIREEEAVRPGLALQKDHGQDVDSRRISRELQGDLDWIALKALEKDRGRRYGTASAFAKDLACYLEGSPVSAAAPTWSYLCGKFARRNRGLLAGAAAVSLALAGGTAVSLWQAAKAVREGERADANRREAEAAYERAKSTVELYLSRVTDDDRLLNSDFSALRSDLLKTALPFYEEMARKNAADPKLRMDQLWALVRIAGIYQQQGDNVQSEAAYRKAAEIARALVAEKPDETNLRSLAMACNNLGTILMRQQRHAESVVALREGLEIERRLAAMHPENGACRKECATVLINIGSCLTSVRDMEEARAAYQESAEIARALVEGNPEDFSFQSQLSASLSALGSFEYANGNIDEAIPNLRAAWQVQERLLKRRPDSVAEKGSLAGICHNLGHALAVRNKPVEMEEAERLQLRALGLHEEMAAEFPRQPSCQDAVVAGLSNLAKLCFALGRDADALGYASRASDQSEKMAAQFPAFAESWNKLAYCSRYLGGALRDRNRHDEAQAVYLRGIAGVQESLRRFPGDEGYLRCLCLQYEGYIRSLVMAGDLETAAQWLAIYPQASPGNWEAGAWAAEHACLVANLAENRIPFTAGSQALLIARCETLAMGELRQSVANGAPDAAQLLQKDEYVRLRVRPDFQALAGPEVMDRLVPRRFEINYPLPPDPGVRVWTREGEVWSERQPSGAVNSFQSARRIMIGLVSGTVLKRQDLPELEFFVPDKRGGIVPRLLMATPGGWGVVSDLIKVE